MKNKIITFSFIFIISSVFVVNLVIPSKDVSYSERRKLQTFPAFSISSVFSGDFMERFDKYTLDQFFLRDQFRSLKAYIEFNIFNKADNNDIYVIGDSVYKMEYPINLNHITNMSLYLNSVAEKYLENCNVYYSIIPDKNYFVAKDNGYLAIDYQLLEKMMTENTKNMTYINIIDSLEIDDYYRTDTHWKQEELGKVVEKLSDEMSFTNDLSQIEYKPITYSPFYGVYYGQSALNISPDILTYLETDTIKKAIVTNIEYKGDVINQPGIYNEEKLGKMDSYDVFLSGATPLITIENPSNITGKELIIFRDSYASSIAPLLIEEYSKITLIDLRYVSNKIIGDYVDFADQDVLFLYSTLLINNSNILK